MPFWSLYTGIAVGYLLYAGFSWNIILISDSVFVYIIITLGINFLKRRPAKVPCRAIPLSFFNKYVPLV